MYPTGAFAMPDGFLDNRYSTEDGTRQLTLPVQPRTNPYNPGYLPNGAAPHQGPVPGATPLLPNQGRVIQSGPIRVLCIADVRGTDDRVWETARCAGLLTVTQATSGPSTTSPSRHAPTTSSTLETSAFMMIPLWSASPRSELRVLLRPGARLTTASTGPSSTWPNTPR